MVVFLVKKIRFKCLAFPVDGRKGSLFGRIIWFSALGSVKLLVHHLSRLLASRGHHFSAT